MIDKNKQKQSKPKSKKIVAKPIQTKAEKKKPIKNTSLKPAKRPVQNKSSVENKAVKPVKPKRIKRVKKRFKELTPKQKFVRISSYVGRAAIMMFLVGIISFCAVVTALTIYVMKFVDPDADIDLRTPKLNYTTIIYAKDPNTGKEIELDRLYTSENRIWVSLDKIPVHLKNAFIAVEDKRFEEHDGVDWKRTFSAFANLFFNFYSNKQGASTITQQLIKNITKENQVRIERKVQEIIRAMNLEKQYSKDEIIEAYMNTIALGSGCNGVQTAANLYFGKDVSELTLAESASIAAITQTPTKYNPLTNPENNKKRQELVLSMMYEQGKITKEEYTEAVNQKLVFRTREIKSDKRDVQSYFIDQVINDVINSLVEEKGYKRDYAESLIYSAGYRIYTTVDLNVQKAIEDVYVNPSSFPTIRGKTQPQSAMVVLSHNGEILGIVGGRGEKTADRVLNRASQSLRQTGSSTKPIAVYAPAIESDIITWSSIVPDQPIKDEKGKNWPVNYYGGYYGPMTIEEAIMRSTNTVAVRTLDMLGVKRSFDFLTNKLGITSLIKSQNINGKVFSDLNLASLALGSMTKGITPLQLAAAYQPIANGGNYSKPYSFYKVVNPAGEVILENGTKSFRVMTPQSAYIVNRLMQRVTTGPYGTGRSAVFSGMPIAGKTGTTSEDKDRWFVGITPYYIGVVWFGYDEPERIENSSTGVVTKPWKLVMTQIHKNKKIKEFPIPSGVVQRYYCSETGELATTECKKIGIGWYKTTNLPKVCTKHSGGNIREEIPLYSSSSPSSSSKPQS